MDHLTRHIYGVGLKYSNWVVQGSCAFKAIDVFNHDEIVTSIG